MISGVGNPEKRFITNYQAAPCDSRAAKGVRLNHPAGTAEQQIVLDTIWIIDAQAIFDAQCQAWDCIGLRTTRTYISEVMRHDEIVDARGLLARLQQLLRARQLRGCQLIGSGITPLSIPVMTANFDMIVSAE
jgi:hypothetical protein